MLEILPEDIPLGLALLFSIKEVDTFEAIFVDLPTTPLALSLVLYTLSVLLQKTFRDVESIFLENPNRVRLKSRVFTHVSFVKLLVME